MCAEQIRPHNCRVNIECQINKNRTPSDCFFWWFCPLGVRVIFS